MSFKRYLMFPIIIIMFVSVFIGGTNNNVNAFSGQVIQRGATGDDVIELQSRLQYNGYYHGTIDGVYGWSTYWAVRNFQKAFGLEEVDGLVGEKTKEMINRFTKYNKQFVYDNLRKGNRFTHYGGVPLSIQSAPSEKTIQKAKTTAEARRIEIEKQYTPDPKQPQGEAQQPKQPQGQGETQQPKQPQGGAQQPKQPQGGAQQPKQPQGGAQQPKQPQGGAQQPKQPQGGTQQPQQPQGGQDEAQQPQQPQEEQAETQSQGPTAVNMPGGFSQNDIQLMANAVYGEARGEPYIGQVAVAAVILNRLDSPTFPDTVSGIIFEPLAFTAVADGQIWLTPNEQAKKAVIDAINGMDPTGGAVYYFNPATATSKWIWGRPQIKKIGSHIFCR
ncbi:cell wall hydrolase [Bacillus sinesaloumensis]|uniref:cell wall hydrolase n=1 Tax=Litchfieldia sinesaloumensis TaxID=1926280 RepID=UPI0009888D3F|nr:cell wall hydrolase [Bacillus sinesaloumensis]